MKIELRGEKGVGKYALVDDSDYELVSQYKWHFDGGYATTSVHGKTVYMHRLILNTPDGMYTDHKNHNKLDNRRSNIWVCTPTENNLNRVEKRGYYYDKKTGIWRAIWSVRGKEIHRTYRSESEAKDAIDMMKRGIIPKCRKRGRPKTIFG